MSSEHKRTESPLVVAKRLEPQAPGFSEGAFFKRVKSLLNPKDDPLVRANKVIDEALDRDGAFIRLPHRETTTTGVQIRREIAYRVKLDAVKEGGLLDPETLDLLERTWSILSGGSKDQPKALSIHTTDMIYDGDGSSVRPPHARYELRVEGYNESRFGDVSMRVGPSSAEIYTHSGDVRAAWGDGHKALSEMLESVSKRPTVMNPIALSIAQTLVNPALIAIGERVQYPHYFNVVNMPQTAAVSA